MAERYHCSYILQVFRLLLTFPMTRYKLSVLHIIFEYQTKP